MTKEVHLLLLVLLLFPHCSSQKSYSINSFATDLLISVTPGNQCTTKVEERIEVKYIQGTFSTFSRRLAVKGFTFGSLIGVYDTANGKELDASFSYETIQNTKVVTMFWNNVAASPDTKTYLLKYSIENLFNDTSSIVSFRWIAAGADWDVDLHNITTRVHLDKVLTKDVVDSSPGYQALQQTTNGTTVTYFKSLQPSKAQQPSPYIISLTLSLPKALGPCNSNTVFDRETLLKIFGVGFGVIAAMVVISILAALGYRVLVKLSSPKYNRFMEEVREVEIVEVPNLKTKNPEILQHPEETKAPVQAPTPIPQNNKYTITEASTSTHRNTSKSSVTARSHSPVRYSSSSPQYESSSTSYDYGGSSNDSNGSSGGGYSGGGGAD